ncbi:MAG: hypothetical protein Q9213_002337 [Squamulea squamosa]
MPPKALAYKRRANPTQILSLIYGALLTASVRSGLGKHRAAIDPSKVSDTLKLYTLAIPFGVIVLALSTLAIAIVLNGLIAPTKRHSCILFFPPILQIVLGTVGITMVFSQCKPTSTLWNSQLGAKCWDKSLILGYVYFMSVYVAFVDIFLAVVPLVAFWKLGFKPKTNIVLCLVVSAMIL